MRFFTPLIAAGVALAAGSALAASPSTSGASNMPSTDTRTQSTTSDTSAAPPPSSSSAPSSSSSSATGSGADTSVSASGAAAALSAGEPVKDSTGATIGSIQSLNTGANGQKMAVIKMGNDAFQVPADRLGAANGAATINMTQAQITSMLHPAAGGR